MCGLLLIFFCCIIIGIVPVHRGDLQVFQITYVRVAAIVDWVLTNLITAKGMLWSIGWCLLFILSILCISVVLSGLGPSLLLCLLLHQLTECLILILVLHISHRCKWCPHHRLYTCIPLLRNSLIRIQCCRATWRDMSAPARGPIKTFLIGELDWGREVHSVLEETYWGSLGQGTC